MDDVLPAVSHVEPQWLDFFVMAGALLLLAACLFVWVAYFRRGRRKHRHRRYHHGERRANNPTLAQTGGLPPVRPHQEPPEKPPADVP